jgi:ABC-type Fe3+ transport system permease subunit
LVIFVLAISEFSVPGLLQVRVFTTEVFTAFAALYDFGRGTMLAVPLLIVSVAVAGITATRLGSRLIATTRRVRGEPLEVFDAWRPVVVAAIRCAILATLVVPVAALAREALRAGSIAGVVRSSSDAVIQRVLLPLTLLGAALATREPS